MAVTQTGDFYNPLIDSISLQNQNCFQTNKISHYNNYINSENDQCHYSNSNNKDPARNDLFNKKNFLQNHINNIPTDYELYNYCKNNNEGSIIEKSFDEIKKVKYNESIKKDLQKNLLIKNKNDLFDYKENIRDNKNIANFNKILNKNHNYQLNVFEIEKKSGKDYDKMIKSIYLNKPSVNQTKNISRKVYQKALESDIFFSTNNNNLLHNKNNMNNRLSYNNSFHNHLSSDVFGLKTDYNSKRKIGEKYLLTDNNIRETNYTNSESHSEWYPKSNVKNYMNINSSNYDIINPFIKKDIYSKERVNTEAQGTNPIHKHKNITEFIDLTRNFNPNFNKGFEHALNKDKKIFFKKHDLCSDFMDLFGEYNSLCDKPFVKKIF